MPFIFRLWFTAEMGWLALSEAESTRKVWILCLWKWLLIFGSFVCPLSKEQLWPATFWIAFFIPFYFFNCLPAQEKSENIFKLDLLYYLCIIKGNMAPTSLKMVKADLLYIWKFVFIHIKKFRGLHKSSIKLLEHIKAPPHFLSFLTDLDYILLLFYLGADEVVEVKCKQF